MNYLINQLNNNCTYARREHQKQFCCKWTERDIEPDSERDYCYNAYKQFELCSNCEVTLHIIKDINANPSTKYLMNIISEQDSEINQMKCDISEIKIILNKITH